MNNSPSVNEPSRRRRGVLAVLLLVGALVAGWLVIRLGPWMANAPAPERTVGELARQNGVLCELVTGRPFTGWLVERYSHGALRSRSWLSNGVMHGLSEGWHTNGVLQIREQFAAGLSAGVVTRWRDDGSKLSEGTAKDGKLEGVFQRWHPDGQLSEEVMMRAGEAHGRSRAWFPDGSLRAEVQLDHGKVVSQRFWKAGERDDRGVATTSVAPP